MTNLSGANLNNGAAVGPQGEGKESPSNFPKYPAYKDSGVEWLGAVPEGWKVSGIKFFADLITGITPPSDDLDNYAEEGWPWVRPEDLNDSGKPVLASKFLTDQGWRFCRKVKRGSTLICCIGTIGKIGFVDSDVCTNQQITAVVPRGNGRFFFYAMQALKPAFDVSATGNVLRILNSERLGNVTMAVPDHGEAESIARFLDHETARIDALIEEQQRLIELLKEKRQAVISHAVTKGLDPTAPMKDSGVEWLGEVPAHWDFGSFRRAIKSVSNGTTADQVDEDANAIAVSRIETISTGEINFEKVGYVKPEDAASRFILKSGDILFSHINSLSMIGNVALYRGSRPLLHGMNLLRIQPASGVMGEWIFYWLKSKNIRQEVESRAKPAINQASISTDSVRSLPVLIPPESEQIQIVRHLDCVVARIDTLTQETVDLVALLQERRSALISAAVTGKIDVRDWQPPASTQAPKLEVAEAD